MSERDYSSCEYDNTTPSPGQRKTNWFFIDKGMDVNAKEKDGSTVLMAAGRSWSGNLEVVKLLIDKGADVNAKNKKGETALSLAFKNHPAILQYLKSSQREVIWDG